VCCSVVALLAKATSEQQILENGLFHRGFSAIGDWPIVAQLLLCWTEQSRSNNKSKSDVSLCVFWDLGNHRAPFKGSPRPL